MYQGKKRKFIPKACPKKNMAYDYVLLSQMLEDVPRPAN